MAGYSSDDNFYGEDDEDEGVTEIELRPCGNCGRNFNVDVLPRHHNVCTKVKQRKAFNSQKQRLAEIEKIPINAPPKKTRAKKKDWRWEHEQFIKNIRAARNPQASTKGNAAPAPAVNPDYVQCPHCERRFNESAAERHMEFCKEQKSRIPKQSDSKYAVKKEKQDKRATYKPPLPGQKKKSAGSTPTKARSNSNSGEDVKDEKDGNVKTEEISEAPSNQRSKSIDRSNSNSNSNSNSKSNSYQPSNRNSSVERETKSDTTLSGRRKKNGHEAQNGERLDNVINARYGKTLSATSRTSCDGSISESDSNKSRSGKTKGGEPKWFEDLKRNDSGTQLRRNLKDDLDSVDSGMDLNENYTRANNAKNSPVGVVRPSSRHNENDFFPEKPDSRTPSSGRRKMANFCHDCGTRYPVPEAKFCCECGVRRMSLT